MTPTLPPVEQTYVVQQGDALAAIAQRFGTTVAAIQGLNGIEDPNEIVIGQVLRIP
ncbi:MAG: LysM domain-containing protein [Candidatus Limnocylindria bacterium]